MEITNVTWAPAVCWFNEIASGYAMNYTGLAWSLKGNRYVLSIAYGSSDEKEFDSEEELKAYVQERHEERVRRYLED